MQNEQNNLNTGRQPMPETQPESVRSAAVPDPATNSRPSTTPLVSEAQRPLSANPGAQTNPRPDELSEDDDLEAQLAYQNLKRKREARKRKRIIIVALVIVAALVAAVVYFTSQANQEAEDTAEDMLSATSEVYRGDFESSVNANGATEPLESTVVTPEVDGIIEGLRVEEGSVVNQGDVLFTLKNDSLDKAVREAEKQVSTAQRTVDTSNEAVDKAYASYQREWDAANAANDWSEFDEAAMREPITSAEDSYKDALDALESAKEALAEAQQQADKRTVVAPVSGSVVAMNAQNGMGIGSESSSSSSSGPLVQIADLQQMKVTVQVNEVDISNIAVGQGATATFSALPDVESEAVVQRIASVSSGSEEGDMGGGVVTYAVDLLIPHPDPKLKPGMTATVTIVTQSVPNTLIVPSSAVQGEEGDWYVAVVEDASKGQTRSVKVDVLARNNSDAAVSGDLVEGDLVLMGDSMDDMGAEDFDDFELGDE